MFAVVTSAKVNYNMDTVVYLIQQEIERRKAASQQPLSQYEMEEFKRQLISKLIVQGDAQGAINLRPTTTRQQLNG